jgi:hypothetical protein
MMADTALRSARRERQAIGKYPVASQLTKSMENKIILLNQGDNLEATSGIEPEYTVLQTVA